MCLLFPPPKTLPVNTGISNMNRISQKLSQKRGKGVSCAILERVVRDNFSKEMRLSKEMKVRGLPFQHLGKSSHGRGTACAKALRHVILI